MRDLPHGFDIYLVNVKTTRKIAQIFVTFSGLENLRNLPHVFYIYLVNVKTMKKIAQIFVAFSEKLNFIYDWPQKAEEEGERRFFAIIF